MKCINFIIRFLIFGFVLTIPSILSYAQGESDIWYFGDQAGLDFNIGNPLPLTNSAMVSTEGCASVSNSTGQLLFYTNGESVWNKNHLLMPNGASLFGSQTCSQSAIIVPYPGNNQKYFVFTLLFQTNHTDLHYSIIDMSLQNGLGDVTSQKNIFLKSSLSEKLVAVNHDNGSDFWVVTRDAFSNNFYSYEISATGINTQAIVSSAGQPVAGAFVGYLKASPYGDKLAAANNSMNFEIYDFDNANGMVSNAITFTFPTSYIYGLEFSPDGTKLYVPKNPFVGQSQPEILQYNLLAGNAQQIINSAVTVGVGGNQMIYSAFQLGPDNKIYLCKTGSQSSLDVINNPNILGVACNFVANAVGLGGNTSYLGLPPLIVENITTIIVNHICLGDTTEFGYSSAVKPDSVKWDFDDPMSGPSNYSNLDNPKHLFTSQGIYNVTIATYLNGTATQISKAVRILKRPNLDLGPDSVVCEGEVVWLDAGIAQQYLWSNTQTSRRIPASASGDYWVEASNLTCKSYDTVNVKVIEFPEFTLGPDTVLCEGDVLNITLFADAPGYYFHWTSCDVTPYYTVTRFGKYWVHVFDVDSLCVKSDTIVISKHIGPTVDLGNDTMLCIGETLELNLDPSLNQVLWMDGYTGKNRLIQSPGQYSVTVDDGVCMDGDTINVGYYPYKPPAVISDTSVCHKNIIKLIASGGNTYQWSPAIDLSCTTCRSPMLYPLTSRQYTVDVTDFNGCQYRDSVMVTVFNEPNSAISPDTSICINQSVQLYATGGTKYNWTPQAGLNNSAIPNPVARVSQTQQYKVEIIDQHGCPNSNYVLITVRPEPQVQTSGTVSGCINQQITLNASGLNQYNWSPSTGLNCNNCPKPQFNVTAPITYYVQGTDSYGCVGMDSVRVTVSPNPVISLKAMDTVCTGDTLSIFASGGVQYNWAPSTEIINYLSANPRVYPSQNRVYTLSILDANGCAAKDSIQVTVGNKPNVSAGQPISICLGGNAVLSGSGALNYNWAPNMWMNNPNIANPMVIPTNNIRYYLTGSDAFGCKAIDSVEITVNPLPDVQVSNDTFVCKGFGTEINALGGYSYQWTSNNGVPCSNCPTNWILPLSSSWYKVLVTDLNGCQNADSVFVEVKQPPQLQVSNDASICPGKSTQLSASGADQYIWSPATGLSSTAISNPVASPLTGLIYNLIGTDQYGCKDTADIEIEIYTVIPALAGPNTSICLDESVELSVNSGANYNWQPSSDLSSGTSQFPVFTPVQTGLHYFSVVKTDVNGCIAEDSLEIEVFGLPNADAGPDQVIHRGQTIKITGFGTGSFSWIPANMVNDPQMASTYTQPLETTIYTLVVTNEKGCKKSDIMEIEVLDELKSFIPNAFTPNDDGKNDKFGIRNVTDFSLIRLQIFNRWGEMVFESMEGNNFWDGTANGAPSQMGVYVYYLVGTDNLGLPVIFKGNVTLIR